MDGSQNFRAVVLLAGALAWRLKCVRCGVNALMHILVCFARPFALGEVAGMRLKPLIMELMARVD